MQTYTQELLSREKKDAKPKGAGAASEERYDLEIFQLISFNRWCLEELPSSRLLLVATSIPRGKPMFFKTLNCPKSFMMLKLMSRKAAIPVPGPIGGGSLSDWKEAEGNKGNSKDDNSKDKV